jgi:DNA-directed RNA polymerase subunit RPC12/RpoP
VKFRILATLSVLLLSAPSALGVQRALAPTRGELAGWLAAVGIELAYLSLAFAAFADPQRQRLAARVARAAVLTAITLNVLADYAARVPAGLSGAAQFLASFDWLLLALSVLESAPLATLAYTLATLLHTHSSSHPQPDASHTAQHTAHTDTHTAQHTAHTDTHTAQHTAHTDTHTAQHTAHTDTHTAHTQRTASYRCPHCGAALAKQQQYAAALRYGHCGKCKGK